MSTYRNEGGGTSGYRIRPSGDNFSPRGGTGSGYSSLNVMPESVNHESLTKYTNNSGSEGRTIDLLCNHYKVTTTDKVIFHYDINMSIRKNQTKENKDIRSRSDSLSSSESDEENNTLNKPEIFKNIPYCYDGGNNLYTTRLIDFKGDLKLKEIIPISVNNRTIDFKVKITNVDQISLKEVEDYYRRKQSNLPQKIVSIYEILIDFIVGKQFSVFQRKFYDLSKIQSGKSDLVQFANGFMSGIRMTEVGLSLNLHLKTACILHSKFTMLVELVTRFGIRPQQFPKNQLAEINRLIRHLKMCTKHNSKEFTYTIDGLVPKTPSDVTFVQKDGSEITVKRYFAEKYLINLQEFPLVATKLRGKNSISIMIPLELCFIPENQFLSNSKIGFETQKELLFKSTHAPNVYFNKITNYAKMITSSETGLQNEFGMQIDSKPLSVQGRVLPAPNQTGNRGSFYRPATKFANSKWGVICFDQIQNDQIKLFANQIIEKASEYGIRLEPPHPVINIPLTSSTNFQHIFYNLFMKAEVKFLFVGIPQKNIAGMTSAQIYGMVKFYCDQIYGIVTQCFKSDYINGAPRGYFENFMLKVNGKLGGLNSIVEPNVVRDLPIQMENTMMIGCDVNHPVATEKSRCSISAAVGSIDSYYSEYVASIRVQEKTKDESIRKLDVMVYELLTGYYQRNSQYPENLIIFRDGTSEGQFTMILKIEIPLIQLAINKTGKKINITLIVVQKRTNTRIVMQNADTSGRNPTFNVPSGTVVDGVIVEPMYKMFYLNSHFSPLGTSKPSKYVILRDDLNMTADQIQKLCFYACYNNIRTRKVLSCPTPIRYADLCAYRAKLHVEAQRILEENSDEEIIEQLNSIVHVNENIQNRLYYC
ncbi:hypothetical protein RDWZM_004883 [Blomia tropicalis]|uniref:Uncharacterized protein n=1 Tax=Blomia tropicalis TaxID=40697 RepID=A0A9Q0RMZ9_BLOTA|nr:hypothetical protein RDWZM_004883 [Blomia tropicalis]